MKITFTKFNDDIHKTVKASIHMGLLGTVTFFLLAVFTEKYGDYFLYASMVLGTLLILTRYGTLQSLKLIKSSKLLNQGVTDDRAVQLRYRIMCGAFVLERTHFPFIRTILNSVITVFLLDVHPAAMAYAIFIWILHRTLVYGFTKQAVVAFANAGLIKDVEY